MSTIYTSTPLHTISSRSVLILSSNLHLGLRISLFLSDFPTNNLYAFFVYLCYMPHSRLQPWFGNPRVAIKPFKNFKFLEASLCRVKYLDKSRCITFFPESVCYLSDQRCPVSYKLHGFNVGFRNILIQRPCFEPEWSPVSASVNRFYRKQRQKQCWWLEQAEWSLKKRFWWHRTPPTASSQSFNKKGTFSGFRSENWLESTKQHAFISVQGADILFILI